MKFYRYITLVFIGLGSLQHISPTVLTPELRQAVKVALENSYDTGVENLYTSIVNGNTPTFASLINNTSDYLKKLGQSYSHPNQIVISIDNQETLRNLCVFDYLPDQMVIDIMQDYITKHKSKPFIDNFTLIECYKAVVFLQTISS